MSTGIASYRFIFQDAKASQVLETLQNIMYGIAEGKIKTPYSFTVAGTRFNRVTAITSVSFDCSPDLDPLMFPTEKAETLSEVQFYFTTVEHNEECNRVTIHLTVDADDFKKVNDVVWERLFAQPGDANQFERLVVPGIINVQDKVRVTAMRTAPPITLTPEGNWVGYGKVEIDFVPMG